MPYIFAVLAGANFLAQTQKNPFSSELVLCCQFGASQNQMTSKLSSIYVKLFC